MAEAQYEILTPSDSVGTATARYLQRELQAPVHLETRNVLIDGQWQEASVVKITIEDTPQADSHVKQTAAYVAEATQQEQVIVSKHGKDGFQTWPVRNTVLSPSHHQTLQPQAQSPSTGQ